MGNRGRERSVKCDGECEGSHRRPCPMCVHTRGHVRAPVDIGEGASNRERRGGATAGRRQKRCKRWWSAKPITLSQIWLPPPPWFPSLPRSPPLGSTSLHEIFRPCTRLHERKPPCTVAAAQLTRRSRTTTVSKIEFGASEVCPRHWFPPRFEGNRERLLSKWRPLTENWARDVSGRCFPRLAGRFCLIMRFLDTKFSFVSFLRYLGEFEFERSYIRKNAISLNADIFIIIQLSNSLPAIELHLNSVCIENCQPLSAH